MSSPASQSPNFWEKLFKSFNLKHKLFIEPIHFIKSSFRKLQNLTETNYRLGMYHFNLRNFYDAKLRFKIVLFFSSKHFMASYRLGCCWMLTNRKDKAIRCFENCLKINPEFNEAKYMLYILGQKVNPPSYIPISIIKEYFDNAIIHSSVEQSQIENQNRKLLLEKIETVATTSYNEMLDIGCGIGKAGILFKPRFNLLNLTGIDVSPLMLAEAKRQTLDNRPVYDNLIEADLISYLNNNDKKFDLIVATGAFNYIGDLAKALILIQNHLLPKAIVAFVVESSNKGHYQLNSAMTHYSYNIDYIQRSILDANLQILISYPIPSETEEHHTLFVCQNA